MRRGGLRALLAMLGALALPAAPAAASYDLLMDPAPWRTLGVPGEPEAEFARAADGSLSLRADDAVAFLYRAVDGYAGRGERLAWRWRVDRPTPASDQARRGEDDRAVAVHLWFRAAGAESLHGDLAFLFGYPRVTHAITYVWGGLRPAETLLPSPYAERAVVVILQDGRAPLGTWVGEARDLRADIARAFGTAVGPEDLAFVAISADSDDTGSRSLAHLAGLSLAASGAAQ